MMGGAAYPSFMDFSFVERENTALMCDGHHWLLNRSQIGAIRPDYDIILPSRISHLLDFAWVQKGYAKFIPELAKIDTLIIAGLSF